MKSLLFILLLAIVATSKATAQITLIPDYRFEHALIDLGIDSDHTINGHILTSDALLITELNISPNTLPGYPYPANDIYDGMIHDLTGIEAFVNLEHFSVNGTMVDNLNLSSLAQLKYLDCVYNMITSINVSNNPLLEYLDISNSGDVDPYNYITEIDLSNNPNINTLIAHGIKKINLNNNNNNLQNMQINVSCNFCFDYPPDYIDGTVCIKVDNVNLALNNQLPYSQWNVFHSNITINYANNLEQCSLGTSKFDANNLTIYPNPAHAGIIHLKSNYNTTFSVLIFDQLGRKIIEKNQVYDSLDISTLQKGTYFLTLISVEGNRTQKLMIE